MELPDIMGLAQLLNERGAEAGASRYPEIIADLRKDEFKQLGERYLEQTRAYRRRGTPRFIDKMPNNFAHIGLIHLILPRARIVDVRRHPMACGFSLFRHLFASGQNFAYSLEDIAGYYLGYVELMAHYDCVLAGRVHRVVYESLVQDAEGEIRRLLDYCGLPFERACLDFHRTDRAVSTPSSEQVRTPIFREGLEHWRRFDAWLGPLRSALGPVVDCYPDVPASLLQ